MEDHQVVFIQEQNSKNLSGLIKLLVSSNSRSLDILYHHMSAETAVFRNLCQFCCALDLSKTLSALVLTYSNVIRMSNGTFNVSINSVSNLKFREANAS